jgi:hypothetical protein
MKSTVFWVVTPCNSETAGRFGDIASFFSVEETSGSRRQVELSPNYRDFLKVRKS